MRLISYIRVPNELLRVGQRSFCSRKFEGIDLELSDKSEVAVLKMNKPPVNSMSLSFLQNFSRAISNAETSGLRGIIITSENPKIFSAGLDLMEFYKPDKKRLASFWSGLQDFYETVYGTKLSTVAAINGHAFAGGAFLSLMCDHRVMLTPKFSIGANETQFGIAAPPWLADLMIDTVGARQAEKALLLGKMFSPEEAFKLGLVDDLASNREELMNKSYEYLKTVLKNPQPGLDSTKLVTRTRKIERFQEIRSDDCIKTVEYFMQDKIQELLERHVSSLKKKTS